MNLTEKEKLVFKIANNAIYFDDGSDYLSALWDILITLNPEMENVHELKFIE